MLKKTLLGAALIACTVAPSAMARSKVFTLKNNTSSVMMYFHASPANVSEWEEDVLGSEVLGPGESVKVTIDDGRSACNYDMRFEFDDESVTEDRQNLCELGSYTLRE